MGTSEALTAALGPGGPGTIPLCPGTTYHGSFTVARNVTVLGAGVTSSILDGGDLTRVVIVNAGVTARLHDVQISNGQAPESDAGGGVINRGTLTLLRCLVTGNQADSGGGIFNGGVAATLTLDSTAVTNNVASEFVGGGVHNSAGLLILQGTSQVAGNRAQLEGGGIYNIGGTARVALQDATVVADNDADPTNLTSGGGIFNNPIAPGTVTFSGTARVNGNRPNNCTGTATCPS